MNLKGIVLVLLVTFFVVPNRVFGQTISDSVSGTVYATNGVPISGANIYAHALKIGSVTDADGRFVLGPIPNDVSLTLVLQVSSIGYRTQRVNARISGPSLTITLKEDLLNLEEVVVEAESRSSQGVCMVKISTISEAQLNRSALPSRIQSLANEPGVDMISMGSGIVKPVIRGLSGLRIATLFRGARIESQAWGEEHGIYLPEQGVDRVEIIRGPSALIFGADAFGGVINFLPSPPLDDIGRESVISLRGFSATSGLQASLQTEKRSRYSHHSFSGGYNAHNSYLLPDGTTAENSQYRQFFAQGTWGYIRDWGGVDGAYSSSYNTTGLMSGAGFQQAGDHIITTSATFFADGWKVKPSVSYQLNHRKEFDTSFTAPWTPDEGDSSAVDIGDVDLSLRTLSYGIQGKKSFGEFEFILGTQGVSTTNTNESVEVFISDAEINEVSGFSISTWERETLTMQAGLRFDSRTIALSDGAQTYSFPSFSFGSTFKSSEFSEFSANYSKGNRAPGLSELTADGVHHGANRYEIGNVMLAQERSDNLDVGFSHSTPSVEINVAIFRNAIRDYIYLSPTGTEIQGFHVYAFKATDAVLRGGEIGLSISPQVFPEFSFAGSASYVRGKSTEDNLPWMPPLNFHSELNWEKNNLKGLSDVFASISADFTASAAHVSAGETSSSAYHVVNVVVGAKVASHVSVSVAASNLFNKTYIPHLSLLKDIGIGIPEAGRNISARLSFSF